MSNRPIKSKRIYRASSSSPKGRFSLNLLSSQSKRRLRREIEGFLLIIKKCQKSLRASHPCPTCSLLPIGKSKRIVQGSSVSIKRVLIIWFTKNLIPDIWLRFTLLLPNKTLLSRMITSRSVKVRSTRINSEPRSDFVKIMPF